MQKYIKQKFIQKVGINDIYNFIWEEICRYFYGFNKKLKKSYQEFRVKIYEKIIQHISEQCLGNIHSKNIDLITSSPAKTGDV